MFNHYTCISEKLKDLKVQLDKSCASQVMDPSSLPSSFEMFFRQPVISQKLLTKSRSQTIFQKFKLNRNLQRIPLKMMYKTSTLRHQFSNERWRGGGGGALNHPPLLFCKSVYCSEKIYKIRSDKLRDLEAPWLKVK